jgi:eukaryotic-like serine/threonine-protein kinase
MIDLARARARAQARVGSTLCGKWTIDQLLDMGGMAAVFAATHRNGNRVAIKLMHDEIAAHEESRERFLREGYVANKVGHPGAVQVLDDDMEGTAPFLVMELLEGESVEARLRRQEKLGIGETLCIADEVLSVLGAGHAQGIVHRDVKPANLFLTARGQVKVLDFGLARVRERSLRGRTTATGALLGTVSYMPPEQARGKHEMIDARSDLWAVGATMFRMLSGTTVHEGKDSYERLVKVMSEHARSLAEVAPAMPHSVVQAVDHALAYQKADRFGSAAEMQRALRASYEDIERVPMPSLTRVVNAAPWLAAGPAITVREPELHVSVIWDQGESGGDSIVVDMDDNSGLAHRVELRRKSAPPAELEDEELSEVSIVEDVTLQVTPGSGPRSLRELAPPKRRG